jgi:AraC-like DNA-binding protein/quercetin dioxygenase-like cupin family protein
MNARVITASDVVGFESLLNPEPMVGLSFDFPSGGKVEMHTHPYGQVVFGSEGVMCIDTPAGTWVVPPQRAVWIPPNTLHEVRLRSSFSMRNLLIAPGEVTCMPTTCQPVIVSNLMRELILRASELNGQDRYGSRIKRLFDTLLDEIQFTVESPVCFAMPRDRRLTKLCAEFVLHPSDTRTLKEWGEVVGASARTLSRLFLAELGVTFDEWRRQVRLQEALYYLAEGKPVASVAYDLGYESCTGFIEMFRKTLGRTPGQYFS